MKLCLCFCRCASSGGQLPCWVSKLPSSASALATALQTLQQDLFVMGDTVTPKLWFDWNKLKFDLRGGREKTCGHFATWSLWRSSLFLWGLMDDVGAMENLDGSIQMKKNFWFNTENIESYSEENIQSTVVESEKVIWRFCLWDVWIDIANGDRCSRIPCQIQIGWIGGDGYGSRQPSWFHVNIFLLQGGTSGTPTTLLDESFAWRVGWLDLIDEIEGFWVSTCHWTDRLKLCNDDVPKLLALLQTIHVLHVIIYWRVVGQSLRDVNLFFCDNWVRKWVRKTVRHKTNWFPKDLFSFSPCYFHYAKIGVSNAGVLSQEWVIFQEFVGNAILTGQIKCPRHSNWANWCWRLAIFVSWDTVNGKHPAPVDMQNIPLFIGFHK